MPIRNETELLEDASATIQEIKAFERDLGIEPTQALAQTSEQKTPTSMLWFWLQRTGTLALRTPIDVRLTLGFAKSKEEVALDQVYGVDGYSVYYRQGNEFADPRSVTTKGFARAGAVRQVSVVIHEDLHGDANFDLPWEIEESLITPLGSLAAAAETIFSNQSVESAKEKIVAMIPSYPVYHRYFLRQIQGQDPETAVEAKLSHDLAYYRYFDQIVALYETTGDLKALLRDLRKAPRDAETLAAYLRSLEKSYALANGD